MRNLSAVALLLLLTAGTALAQDPITDLATTPVQSGKVNLFYCVPTDKQVNQSYVSAISVAGIQLMSWYASQVPGHKTFALADVKVLLLPHDSAYYANSTQPSIFAQFFANVAADALPRANGIFNDPFNVYVFIVDATPICNECAECGAIDAGVYVMSENDLLGLASGTAGSGYVDACTNTSTIYPTSTYIGILGHALGLDFGLSYPPGCNDGQQVPCDFSALMWGGYTEYPNTHLTDADKAFLASNFFFSFTLTPKHRAGR